MALTPLLPRPPCAHRQFSVYLGGGGSLRPTRCSIWCLLGRGTFFSFLSLWWLLLLSCLGHPYAHSSHLGFIWGGAEGLRPTRCSIWGLLGRGHSCLWWLLLLSCLGHPYAHSSHLVFIWWGGDGLRLSIGVYWRGGHSSVFFPSEGSYSSLASASLCSQAI